MARRQHLGHAQQRARGGGVRERPVLLVAAQRLAVDGAAQAAQAGLLAGTDAGRREDRLLDVALDDLVAEQPDVAASRAARPRRVGDNATNLRKQRVPGREHDLAATAQAALGQHEQRDAAVVDGLEHGLRGGLQHADELVHRPDVELVEVAGLAADADQVRVGVTEEAARALGLAQDVVEERVRAADEVRAATRVHGLVEHDAEAIAGLIAARPEVAERPRLAVALDREVIRAERIGGVHEGEYPTSPRCAAGASVDWLGMADGGYLGAGGRLAGGPADELVEAAYAHELRAAPRTRLRPLAVRHRARRGARRERRAAGPRPRARCSAACSSCTRSPPPSSLAGRARRRVQLARGRARAAHRRRRRRLAERRPAAPRGLPRGAARMRAAAAPPSSHERSPTAPARSRGTRASCATALAADYTYLQAAQPTTAGHLLLAYAYPALRDAERLRHAHRELSRSVAGAGGSAGSRWPLDRAPARRAARLRRPRRARQGRRLAVGRVRRAARDARDLGHAPLAARAGLRDLREPRVRPDRAGRPRTRARAR